MEPQLAPIVLFVYNRPVHTRKTLEALAKNDLSSQSVLYVFADGPKKDATAEEIRKISEVKEVVKERKWCRDVHLVSSDINIGLANSVINGVTEIINKYGSVIVLEDDLITSKGFLRYMNEALEKYFLDEQVMQISGYCFPLRNIPENHTAFFIPLTTSWGWATWKRAWGEFDSEAKGYEVLRSDRNLEKKFNLDGIYPYSKMLFSQMEGGAVDSWAIRWWWSVFRSRGLVLFPDKSLVDNRGYDSSATHTNRSNPFLLLDFDAQYYILNFPDKAFVNEDFFLRIKESINPQKVVIWKSNSLLLNVFTRIFHRIFK